MDLNPAELTLHADALLTTPTNMGFGQDYSRVYESRHTWHWPRRAFKLTLSFEPQPNLTHLRVPRQSLISIVTRPSDTWLTFELSTKHRGSPPTDEVPLRSTAGEPCRISRSPEPVWAVLHRDGFDATVAPHQIDPLWSMEGNPLTVGGPVFEALGPPRRLPACVVFTPRWVQVWTRLFTFGAPHDHGPSPR